MKTQYYSAMSLDGFIADENHSLDWLLASGSVPPPDSSYADFIRDVGAIAMGSTTYEWMVRYLTEANDPEFSAWPYEQPCWVFSSRRLRPFPGADLHFAAGDVAQFHRAMVEAAAGKNIWVAGGGDLAGQFYDGGLLDELIIQIAPVTLGKGAPVFPRRATTPRLEPTAISRYADMFELRYDIRRVAPVDRSMDRNLK